MSNPKDKLRRQNGNGSARIPSAPYAVDMTASAETVYKDLYRKAKEAENAGNSDSSDCTTFRMVNEAIREIIPKDPIAKKYALRGDLSNIFRLRKGRMRILWIASSKIRRVCIMFISETLRKEGDANDPYVIFSNLMATGQLDTFFKQYGVRMPHLSQSQKRSAKPH